MRNQEEKRTLRFLKNAKFDQKFSYFFLELELLFEFIFFVGFEGSEVFSLFFEAP